jgi:hypothetical protein
VTTKTKHIIGWSVGIAAMVATAIGSLAALPNGGGKSSDLPIPGSATTAEQYIDKLPPQGFVPKTIAETILVPVGFNPQQYKNLNTGGTLFDSEVNGTVNMSATQIGNFYRAALPDAGWHLVSDNAVGNGYEIFATKAANGYYWEVGIKDPVTGSGTAKQTTMQLRLLQVSFS